MPFSGRRALGGESTTGLGIGSASAEPAEIDQDAPGHNPFAIWPARSTELQERMDSPDPAVSMAAAEEAARSGDGELMFRLGQIAFARDEMEAANRWWEQSANVGFPEGMALVASYIATEVDVVRPLTASAALCGNGLALMMVAGMAQDTRLWMKGDFPSGLGVLDDPRRIGECIHRASASLRYPARLPLYRRSTEPGWPGSLGTITWWALLEGHLQLGLDQGYELMPMVSVDPRYNDPASWAYEVGNVRSNMTYLRLCQGEDATRLAQELPMWAGQLGQRLAPTEVFLIPEVAKARAGDLAGARATVAGWSSTDVEECRNVAAAMAAGRGPITNVAAQIQALLP